MTEEVSSTMAERKPKVEGEGSHRSRKKALGSKQEYYTKVVGLEKHTFDCRHPKYAAKFTTSLKATANYVQREYENMEPVARGMRGLTDVQVIIEEEPTLLEGVPVEDPRNDIVIFKWKENWKLAKRQEQYLESNTAKAYALVWEQCLEAMKTAVKGLPGHEQIADDVDLIELLKEIKGVACNHQANVQGTYALVQSTKTLWTHIQLPHVTNDQYMENFMALVGVIEHYGGSLECSPGLVTKKLNATQGVTAETATAE